MPSSTTTRWCPTPEQVMMLEELYRRGMKTPSSSQIQRITAHLSLYGKIQGKNVFYWFQNHKARDRQKLRNKLAKQLHQPHPDQLLQHHNHLYQYNYQLHPPTQFTHHFQAPSLFPACFSTQNLNPQDTSEAPGEVVRQTWRAEDLPEDGLMRSYGHDSMMIIDAGPTFPWCRSKPLQTLELFPLNPTLYL